MRSDTMRDWHADWGHHHMRDRTGRDGHHGHRGRHGHHERFGGRRGGGGRFFDHGELRYVVLSLLGEQPRHGYDIMRAIDERTGGAYSPSPGVIYPTLQLLADVGHVAPATSTADRNSYQITPEGRAFLEEHGSLVKDIMARMKQAGRHHASASPAIVDAMDSLKSALRSGAGTWSEAEMRDVAAAIETAAGQIRRLRDGPRKPSK